MDVVSYNRLRLELTEQKSAVSADRTTEVETISVGDTGASVTFSDAGLLRELGCKKERLVDTEVTLFAAANKKKLTSLRTIPVVTVRTVDGNSEAKINEMLYIVEELTCCYISRGALVELGSVPAYFLLLPPPRREYGEVAEIRGTAIDMDMEDEKPLTRGERPLDQ